MCITAEVERIRMGNKTRNLVITMAAAAMVTGAVTGTAAAQVQDDDVQANASFDNRSSHTVQIGDATNHWDCDGVKYTGSLAPGESTSKDVDCYRVKGCEVYDDGGWYGKSEWVRIWESTYTDDDHVRC